MPQAETKPLARSRSISPAATAKRARVGQGAMVEASPAPQPPSDPAAQARNSEFVRLLQQALSDLGHCSISEQVAVATGVASEHAHIRTMRKQIEAGQWLDACESIRLCPDVTTQQCSCVQFVLLREHVLELIAKDDAAAALRCIRQRLQPLRVYQDELHSLTGSVLCGSVDNGEIREVWLGTAGLGKKTVLERLRMILPAEVLLPPSRLQTLVTQAVQAQLDACAHTDNWDAPRVSLLRDAAGSLGSLPTRCSQVLRQHSAQIWDARFSPDGTMLVTGCRDSQLHFWKVDAATRRLEHMRCSPCGHGEVLTLEWSPDGTRVAALTSVAVEQEHSTYLWICNVRDDACMELKISSGESASLTWSPDGERLFSCAHDQSVCMIGTSAAAASAGRRPDDRQWRPGKAHDITTSPDGRWLAVSFGASVKLYALPLVLEGQCHETMRDVEVGCFKSSDTVVHVRFSADSQHLLLDTISRTLIVCSIEFSADAMIEGADFAEERCAREPVTITAQRHLKPPGAISGGEKYRLQPCFGGKNDAFVAVGTSWGKVRLWHWRTGKFLLAMNGHDAAVNCVAWSPTDNHLLVSVSDDRTVRVWTSPEAQ